jgi:cytidylate kinase
MRKDLIITIDGPSGAGKSTVARMLAAALGYAYVDTGAMYRAVAYASLQAGPDSSVDDLLGRLSLRFDFSEGAKVFLNDTDISGKLRNSEVSRVASDLSQNRKVREYLTRRQRELGTGGGVVLEGRDTGSVVFPDAQVKFYLDADLDERARRRHLELSLQAVEQEVGLVKSEMARRDKNDSTRTTAPLVVPEGAEYVDTTGIDPRGVVDLLLHFISQVGP